MLQKRFADKITGPCKSADAPLEDALALMVRERLTGQPNRLSRHRRLVDLWRPWIEEKAGAALDSLDEVIHDQSAFSRLSRDILADLDMSDELGDDPDENDEDEIPINDDGESEAEQEQQETGQEDTETSATEEMEQGEADDDQTMEDAMEMDGSEDEMDGHAGREEPEGDQPWRPELPFASMSNDKFYKVYTNEYDERSRLTNCAMPRN
jgi:cobaltochelatase CobT